MASITIDLTNRLFIEVGTVLDGNTSYDIVQDFYLPWKQLLLANFQNLGYPQAMRYVGLDPLTNTQDLGATYFFMNRFRFQPGEWDHEVELVGNLWPDPFTNPLIVPTTGDYTVLVKQRVSNLVDSSVARLDLNQLLQAIYVDTVLGTPGTDADSGTPTNPVDNLSDAVTLLAARNLHKIVFSGNLTLNQNFSNVTFEGNGYRAGNTLALAGYDVDTCAFYNCSLSGTMSGTIEAETCELLMLAGLAGVFSDCKLSQDFGIAANSNAIFRNCYSGIAGGGTIKISMTANALIQFRNYSGGVELENFGPTNAGSIDLDPGRLVLNANCTGGVLLVRGVGDLIRNDGGAVTLNDDGLVYGGAGVAPTASEIADAVWDEPRVDHTTPGSLGDKLGRQLNLVVESPTVIRESD